MIYISAQPDKLYFLWQLEIQLYHFSKLGIKPEHIQVLIGYKPEKGLHKAFQKLIEEKKEIAQFFTYPDMRKSPKYESSIRPHILKKHFKAYPSLEKETLFYHDSDILFRERINEELLAKGTTWYVSDTRSYLSASYLHAFGKEVLKRMCKIVGIAPVSVESQEENTGGAQYILKNVSYKFWEKIEEDAEALFSLVNEMNEEIKQANPEKKTIQAWCADMWAVLWNAWKEGHEVKIAKELDFCWPKDDLHRWEETKILHNAGVYPPKAEELFCKGFYTHHSPYFNDFNTLDKNKCSIKIVELIEEYAQTIERIDLQDVTFIIPVRIDSEDRLENLNIVTRYLTKHFWTNILVIEADDIPRVNDARLSEGVEYLFVQDDSRILHRTRYLNLGIKKSQTAIVSIYDTDVLMPYQQILKAVKNIRAGQATMAYPFDGRFINIDRRNVGDLKRSLSCNGLMGLAAHANCIETSYGGCCFIDRAIYQSCGLENEHFKTWGPDDIERAKRIQILGYQLKRVAGPLFHLNHYRGRSSTPPPHQIFENDKEYIKICNFRKPELEKYITTWEWAQTG